MLHWRAKRAVCIFVIVVAGLLLQSGCEPGLRDQPAGWVGPNRGKGSIDEAVAALRLHRNNVMAVRAGGNCLVEWYDRDGKKHQENPTVQLRFYPPDRLYFSGDILGSEALRLGCNADEFWFRIKPKEVSGYWWGDRRLAAGCTSGKYISPDTLLEAMGIVEVDKTWQLVGKEGYDILTLYFDKDKPFKRIYVDWRDYLIKKIEYFDSQGQTTMVMQLGDYTTGADSVIVPAHIAILNIDTETGGLIIDMTLRDIKLFMPTKELLGGKLFARPDTEGFENVYVLIENCKFIPMRP